MNILYPSLTYSCVSISCFLTIKYSIVVSKSPVPRKNDSQAQYLAAYYTIYRSWPETYQEISEEENTLEKYRRKGGT